MKVAMVKQVLDPYGPWASGFWHETGPRKWLEAWPIKITYWAMTCLLKADWFVMPQQRNTDCTYWSVLKHPGRREIFHKHTKNIVKPSELSFDGYDVAIFLDPFLKPPASGRTLFVYFLNEDMDSLYRPSLCRPMPGYDLFLAHMMDAVEGLRGLPAAVNFPYLQDPEVSTALFGDVKTDAVWIDWRTLTILGMEDLQLWTQSAEKASARVEEILGIPVFFNSDFGKTFFHVTDPPVWGSGRRYLESIGKCRYYVSIGREGGAGQGICDAASVDCICIGERHRHFRAYHRLICHPECLCADLSEMPRRLRRVMASADLRAEVLAWQRAALKKHFVEKPLALLEEALALKRGKGFI